MKLKPIVTALSGLIGARVNIAVSLSIISVKARTSESVGSQKTDLK